MSKFVIFRNIFYNNYAIIFIYDSLVFKISIISHNNIILGGILYMNNANLSKKCKKTLSEELQKFFSDFFSDFTKLLTTPLDLESSCIPNQHIQAAIIEIIAKKLLPNYSIQLKKNGVHIKEENHSVLFNSLLSLEPEINSILRKKNFYKMLSNTNWSTEIKEIYLSKLLSGHSIKSILTADFYICLLPIIEKKINNIVCDMNIDSRNRKKYLYKKDFYGMSLQLLQNHMDNSKAWYNSKNSLLTQLSNLRLTRKQGASEQYKCKFTILNKSILDKAFVNLMHYKYINHQVKAPKFESAPELFPVSNTQVLTSTPRFLLKSLNTKLSKEKIEAVTNIIMSEIQYYNILISKELLPSKNEAENILEENSDEPYADILAKNIYSFIRSGMEVETTGQLYKIIDKTLNFIEDKNRKDIVNKTAARVFQALRIEVNQEFEVLYEFVEKLPYILKPGGRVAILTFHSGEDRIVKKTFKEMKNSGVYEDVCRNVIRPTKEECHRNSRAKSTKMRWAIKAK